MFYPGSPAKPRRQQLFAPWGMRIELPSVLPVFLAYALGGQTGTSKESFQRIKDGAWEDSGIFLATPIAACELDELRGQSERHKNGPGGGRKLTTHTALTAIILCERGVQLAVKWRRLVSFSSHASCDPRAAGVQCREGCPAGSQEIVSLSISSSQTRKGREHGTVCGQVFATCLKEETKPTCLSIAELSGHISNKANKFSGFDLLQCTACRVSS